MSRDFNIESLALKPGMEADQISERKVGSPKKISKRQSQFVMVPWTLALLWQIFAIDGRDWIPESRFQ